jgi:hypothetical protein
MNLTTQILVTAAVMAGALLIYDLVRSSPAPAEPVVASADRTLALLSDRLDRLEGRDTPRLSADPKDLTDRVADLERRLGAAAPTAVVPGSDPSAGPADATSPAAPGSGSEDPSVAGRDRDTGAPRFDEKELARFRANLEEVERRRREEEMRDGVKRTLETLGIRVTESQERALLASTTAYRAELRNLWRGSNPRDDATREQTMARMTQLRDEWTREVNAILPAADAEKFVNSSGRGGFGMGGGFGDFRGPGGPVVPVPVPPGR